jgi:hypothetical protein
MIRFPTLPLGFVLALMCLPAPSLAEQAIKVSFSHDDPDLQTIEHTTLDELSVYVFADGAPMRGGEFGLVIEGADFVRYEMDTFFAWLAMPLPNPYPGTISQATGPDCLPPPVYFGKIILKPQKRGQRIFVDVIPSLWSSSAALLNCETEMINGFRAYPATANPGGKPEKTHRVEGGSGEHESETTQDD